MSILLDILRFSNIYNYYTFAFLSGNFTLFCPTNNAFDAVSADNKAKFSNEADLLRQVVMFHAADGVILSSQLSDNMLIDSLVLDAKLRINMYSVNGKKVGYSYLFFISFNNVSSHKYGAREGT